MINLFVRPLREALRREGEATFRFETSPGQQGQVDWGTNAVWLGDRRVRARFFALVQGYSRRMFTRGFPNARMGCLLGGQEAAFAWFGGAPHELFYDNHKTFVKDRNWETGLEEWFTTVADVRVHGTTRVRPIDRFAQETLIDLRHVPPYRLESPVLRQVGSDARVCYKGNRYCVPWRLVCRQVEVCADNDEVVLPFDGQTVARQALLAGRFQESVNPSHF